MERLCKEIAYVRIPPGTETGGVWPRLRTSSEAVALPTVDCAPGEVAERIVQFYRERDLDTLFVFRFEALHFVHAHLDSFPVRYLDLDELPSRCQAETARIRKAFGPAGLSPAEKTAQATARLLEKALIPRFHRVFVASAVEAEEVSRQTGFQQALVLPNVYPACPAPPGKRTSARNEILFVGSLFYYPNVDAVLYFCREILPVIQEIKGDSVLFRIIGTGCADALECVKHQRGVEVMGYQESLAAYYAEAAVVVVPIRAGAGTRLKILEAFAHGRPVVSTRIGAEGIEVTDRKNILLADDAAAFAHACIEIMDQPKLAEEICEGATRLHRDRYSEEALLRCYEKITSS
jgi:glycosyltransferase involved in cell wall biosynthesis